jgi:hypothetical protein
MLKREYYGTRKDGVNLYRTYSDEGFKIKQLETGNIYEEAIDIEDAIYTYEETDEKILKPWEIEEDVEGI